MIRNKPNKLHNKMTGICWDCAAALICLTGPTDETFTCSNSACGRTWAIFATNEHYDEGNWQDNTWQEIPAPFRCPRHETRLPKRIGECMMCPSRRVSDDEVRDEQ